MYLKNSVLLQVFALAAILTLGACSTLERNPLPEDKYPGVTVLGYQNLRQWGDEIGAEPLAALINADDVEIDYSGIMHREHNYLVISGGGQDGAYAAGMLVGWTELGARPEFTIVTGVSTGALIAPFAFLGSEYDDRLREVFTTHDTENVYTRRDMFSIFTRAAAVDTTPLTELLETHFDDEMIAQLAREYRRGRHLAIGTTNLDAGRQVIWDVTRIAATGHPQAGPLIRSILLASASLPGLFPPVFIEVESADGERYDEMHVDGGVTAQMFLYPADMDWKIVQQTLQVKGTPTVYLIRNGQVEAKYEPLKPTVTAILNRTVKSLIRTQAIGDYYRISSLARRDGLEVVASWIPKDAVGHVEVNEHFDPDYMNALFEYGYQRVLSGKAWWRDDN
jgi:predicted acylesterase/phospholipase RssA